MMAPLPKRSGLQRDVLSLYRRILKKAVEKDNLNTDGGKLPIKFVDLLREDKTSTNYAAQEFRRQASTVPRSDFKRVEYMIRKGEKNLKLLAMPGVKVVSGV